MQPLEMSLLERNRQLRLERNSARRQRDEAQFDLTETLKAVLHFYGPEGAEKVTTHVLMARKAKVRNEEIDALEKTLNQEGDESH